VHLQEKSLLTPLRHILANVRFLSPLYRLSGIEHYLISYISLGQDYTASHNIIICSDSAAHSQYLKRDTLNDP
jgi:hypothetical protein